MATITETFIEKGRSNNGGWSKAQLALLGVEWPPPKGWRKAVIGKSISDNDARRFIELNKDSSSQMSLFDS